MTIRALYLSPLLFAACTSHDSMPEHATSADAGATTGAAHGSHTGTSAEATSTDATSTDATSTDATSTDATSTDAASFSTIPDNAILVANGGTSELTLIDATTLEIVGSVPVMAGMHPHHISVSPSKSKVLISATSADLSLGHGTAAGGHDEHGGAAASTVVYQLDVSTGAVVDVLTVEATAHNAAFTADGSMIVLGMMEHGMVVGYDAVTFAESFSATGFDMPLEVTPTGLNSVLVAESGSAQVAVLDLNTHLVTGRFDVGDVPVAAWASGGADYFVSAEEGMQLRHITEGASELSMDEHVIDVEGMPGQAMLTPDGKELWVALEDTAKLLVLDSETHELVAELAAGTKPHGVVFDATGERAFVTDESAGEVLVIDVSARSVSSKIVLGGNPNGVVWLSKE